MVRCGCTCSLQYEAVQVRQELTAGCLIPVQTSHHTTSSSGPVTGAVKNGLVLLVSAPGDTVSNAASVPFLTGVDNPAAP